MPKALPVDVTGRSPKGPFPHDPLAWSRRQIGVASDIVDNPGGGLLFATQAMGQVRSTLQEVDEDRWAGVIDLLERAEDHAIRREFNESRRLLAEALRQLG